MEPSTALKHTPFHEFHRAAGAKLVDFAGFEMPVRYTGDVREHQAVRTGISKPAKSTSFAPAARWNSWNGVRFSAVLGSKNHLRCGRTGAS